MKKRAIALILVMMLAISCFAGCNKEGGKKDEKVFTIASNMNMTTTAPWQSSTDGDFYIFYNIYSRLIETDVRGHYYPDFAESWECAEDGKTWTFHLTEGFYWHTGNDLFGKEKVEVTAEDVKYSFEYVMNPDNACTRLEDLRSTIESINVIDKYTIQFVTKEIDTLFEYKCCHILIIPKQAAEKGFDLTKQPVGSGPFKWESNIVDTEVVLVKNEDYFIEPNLDKVIFKFITETSVAAMALANEEVDHVSYFAYTEMPTVQDCDFIEVHSGSAACRWTGINVQHELFTDVKVRRAMAHFIDMDAVVAAVYPDDGSGVVQAIRAYGQIPVENLAGNFRDRYKAVTPEYNPEAGHKLMEEAGWKKNANGIYEKDGKVFKFDIQVGTNDPIRMNCAVIMATMLSEQGFEVNSKAVEWGTHLADVDAGNCPMYLMGGYAGVDGPMKVMHTDPNSFSPNPGYSNPEVDALLEEAWRTVDSDARAELIAQAQEIWLYDTVYMPIYYSYSFNATNTRVANFYVDDQYPGLSNISFSLVSRERNVDIVAE